MKIAGKLALVTGASSGIGAATAVALAAKGARLLLLARTQSALEKVAAGIDDSGGEAAAVYALDLTDAGAVLRVAQTIKVTKGTPDILINNAGAGRFLFVEETPPAEAAQMMAAPYLAAFYVTHAFMPTMLARRHGHIVNVTSPAAFAPWPGATAYTAARWAMRGFTKALQADLHKTGIDTTLVVPGKVSSAYFANNPRSEERLPTISRLYPTLAPQQVATAVVDGIEKNRRTVITPFSLRLTFLMHKIFPGLVERLLVETGWKREHRNSHDSPNTLLSSDPPPITRDE